MDALLIGVLGGVVGTFVMDTLNSLCVRIGLLVPIDHRMIGRLARGWLQGRYVYEHPEGVPAVDSEIAWGYGAHYFIGITLALAYVFGWNRLMDGPASPAWAVVYGVATTAAAYLLLFPSIGLGLFGLRSPRGIRLPVSSLVNHFFYGLGLAAVVWLL